MVWWFGGVVVGCCGLWYNLAIIEPPQSRLFNELGCGNNNLGKDSKTLMWKIIHFFQIKCAWFATFWKVKLLRMRMFHDILKIKVDLVCLGPEGCHNRGKMLLIFFHVSDHLKQFGGVLIYSVKYVILTKGVPPYPWKIPWKKIFVFGILPISAFHRSLKSKLYFSLKTLILFSNVIWFKSV